VRLELRWLMMQMRDMLAILNFLVLVRNMCKCHVYVLMIQIRWFQKILMFRRLTNNVSYNILAYLQFDESHKTKDGITSPYY